jgi:Rrf2 family protein
MQNHLLKISDAASLALHTGILLASDPARLWSTPELTAAMQVSGAHLAKVLQRLTKARLVRSVRGPKGGFTLARPAAEVTLLQVYEAIEGPLEPPTCLLGAPVCRLKTCMLGGLVAEVDARVRTFLEGARLSDVASEHAPSPGAPIAGVPGTV